MEFDTVSEVLNAMEAGTWSLSQLRSDDAPPTDDLLNAMDLTGLHVWERHVNRMARGVFTVHCKSSEVEGGYAGYIRNDDEFNWVESHNLSRFTLDEARACREHIINHVDADAIVTISFVSGR